MSAGMPGITCRFYLIHSAVDSHTAGFREVGSGPEELHCLPAAIADTQQAIQVVIPYMGCINSSFHIGASRFPDAHAGAVGLKAAEQIAAPQQWSD